MDKKSYLIDTLLKQMPVPPIFLRIAQTDNKKRIVREVIDGQQRISCVLDFIPGQSIARRKGALNAVILRDSVNRPCFPSGIRKRAFD